MIFTETREGRRFVGEVPPGQPLVATLRTLAENYRIGSGWFDGTGYVRNARVRAVAFDGSFGDPVVLAGTWLLSTMRAAVSEKAGGTDVLVRAQLAGEDGRTVAGVLDEAESRSVELMAWTFDDITLRRYDDPDAGFGRWLDVAVNMVSSDPEAVRSGRVAMEAMPSRLLEAQEMPVLKVGDALEHPRLGTCIVTQVFDQDRVAIQMESGKIAQLHLGLLTLTKAPGRHGRTVYAVQVRRRNA